MSYYKCGVARIGPLLVIVDEELAALRDDAVWVLRDTEAPARDVDVMHAIVANVARAEVLKPAPVRGMIGALEWHLRHRAEPLLVVEFRWRFAVRNLLPVARGGSGRVGHVRGGRGLSFCFPLAIP